MTDKELAFVEALASTHPALEQRWATVREDEAPHDPLGTMTMGVLGVFTGRSTAHFSDAQLDAVADVVERGVRDPDDDFSTAVCVGFLDGLMSAWGRYPDAQRLFQRLGPRARGHCGV